MKRAVILVGHGSRQKGFDAAMKKVARRLSTKLGRDARVGIAFLNLAPPSVDDAIDDAARVGFREVKVVPYFVQAGRHVREDLPGIVARARRRHRGRLRVALCPYLGYDEGIVGVVKKRLSEAR